MLKFVSGKAKLIVAGGKILFCPISLSIIATLNPKFKSSFAKKVANVVLPLICR